MRFEERVIGCLQGLATGDAIGKQTETLRHADVSRWYPAGIEGFQGQPGDVIPRYAGKRYPWRIGETTDDTEQTLAVARALLREGGASHRSIGGELLTCSKSLHPGVRLWSLHQSGDPASIATDGDGCGAAMRAAPIGVMHRPCSLAALVQGAYECAIPTHGGQFAICAAAAVAAAVSAALDGQNPPDVLSLALDAARAAEPLRPQTRELTMAICLGNVYSALSRKSRLSADDLACHFFPDTPENIVPLAIVLGLLTQSATETALLAANLGGDGDSVASIGGAIAGALCPGSVNQEWFQIVSAFGDADILGIAHSLANRWPRP